MKTGSQSQNPLQAPTQATRPLNAQQAMQQAYQHQAQGELRQAEILLRRVLQAQPQHAEALHLLGVVAHQAGNLDTAIRITRQAIRINPESGLYHANLGEMCRQVNDLDQAIVQGEQAIKLAPGYAPAHSNLGIAYFDRGELDKAHACQLRALEINPGLVSALNNLGSIARERGERESAVDYFRQVLAIAPQHLESLNNLGTVLTELERPEEGMELLTQAVRLKPGYAEAHGNLAMAFAALEQYDKAETGYLRAIALRPDYAEAHLGLAHVYHQREDLARSQANVEKALSLSPNKASAYSLLGSIYNETGYPEKALSAFTRSLDLDPKLPSAYLGRGQFLLEQGDLKAAEADFRQALQADNNSLSARHAITQVAKVTAEDDNFRYLVEESRQLDTMKETKAIVLHFALGKCYDDTGEYDLAFEHYREGCRLKRQRIDYDPATNDRFVANIQQFFSASAIDAMRGEGCPSDTPIFILGMPRSGTTLTEQIIASHPDVYGAGELMDMRELGNQPVGGETAGYPAVFQGFTHEQFSALGARYVEGLIARAPEARCITDKMPFNFDFVGLIHLMLPNAKIIHVKRNPMDTCLSSYMRLFLRGLHQSYDLAEIGRYYRNYAKLMAHWRGVLPAGAFYEVQYEDLVADTEQQARALIDYCGLEWDPNCLEFYKNKRMVRTASVTQVRQPIYRTSVDRWRRYERHLDPLFEALGDVVPERGASTEP